MGVRWKKKKLENVKKKWHLVHLLLNTPVPFTLLGTLRATSGTAPQLSRDFPRGPFAFSSLFLLFSFFFPTLSLSTRRHPLYIPLSPLTPHSNLQQFRLIFFDKSFISHTNSHFPHLNSSSLLNLIPSISHFLSLKP